MEFLVWMFATPDAQTDPYSWGAVLLGHFAIGICLTAVAGWISGAWRGAIIVAVTYAIAWEGGQMLLAGSGIGDSAVDAAAVACGAIMAAGAWRNRGVAVGLAMLVLAAIGMTGVQARRRDQ
ncbi:hypothetical protein [Paracoccus sp. JM45]|uniref:hypothetical protein n=1 Tax=Paracoccus sp. JM45 TaxID=2283626 RepID=UPI000E6D19CC|nr:hypothetical protein [Paracoccus sp. JM45]RJE81265.1 hypothetical protein DWB67_00995 [Paracoccus sp. JM45]